MPKQPSRLVLLAALFALDSLRQAWWGSVHSPWQLPPLLVRCQCFLMWVRPEQFCLKKKNWIRVNSLATRWYTKKITVGCCSVELVWKSVCFNDEVAPGVISPAFSASSIMLLPILSLTLLHGSMLSSFKRIVAWQSTARRLRRICRYFNLQLEKVMSCSWEVDKTTNHGSAADNIHDWVANFGASHRSSTSSNWVWVSVGCDIYHTEGLRNSRDGSINTKRNFLKTSRRHQPSSN